MDSRPNIFAIVEYRDAAAAIEWLCSVFGFEKLHVVANEDGSIAHSELQLGPGVILPSSIFARVRRLSSGSLSASRRFGID